ncbi:Protein kinase [Komagataella phaffii CBS 7435]|uniref:non-specific serine/threonine protein kinase n=2 Tax=Komagataella phaffii TaxID=460519 RepID=C4R6H2_KOMPG|nr:Protein kinase implicated in activation of the plasma membrane H(+)-ATPase Pma1p [Komagataella phaffii GS115]AOA63698.1 GQ67_04230T0 [Komagataella phaffii]CAH2448998.1 Protein kinase [Komagataella phaffii CBS 7435]AOA68810.1 GQ68_04202T0 [Komagataella phaffii GS115]CAY71158.1 Protein kinase implicated in activation of the plasma membrane H(+)-ATPase Pma1p [Komagataella phaffii GS115]CCA39042.1 Protein kinase [Komagataella phaffii CBS 7435]
MPSKFLSFKKHHYNHHDSEGDPEKLTTPPLGKPSNLVSRKSFLGIPLGKTHSSESFHSEFEDHSSNHQRPNSTYNNDNEQSKSSMVELKRFFRPTKKLQHASSSSTTPSRPITPSIENSGAKATFTHDSDNNMVLNTSRKFLDDLEGSLVKKYGKLGKTLGSGAGGSVRLLTRESDGVTFAVKEFRPRRPNENSKEYAKKCTAEFFIGSTLKHPNVIQIFDIISEHSHYYQVMEYAPIDFFAVVMSGKMSRSEINCCLKQITLGVAYMHSVGLAHRDLKLDNCVVTSDGIIKLIDFGSAVIFKYPFEEKPVAAHGIVGSDPYLAPEVLTSTKSYDPQAVDVWSIAIIYCCMTLRRFPWKAPKLTDNSFKLYAMNDDEPHDYVQSALHHKHLLQKRKQKALELQLNTESNTTTTDKELVPSIKHPNEMAQHEVSKSVEGVEEIGPAELRTRETLKIIRDKENTGALTKQFEDIHIENNVRPNSPEASLPRQQDSKPERRHAGHTKIHKQIHGRYRLMRLLPHSARPIMSRLLEIDVEKRATIKDLLEDGWFSEIKYCTQDERGNVISAENHQHTIVLGDVDTAVPSA